MPDDPIAGDWYFARGFEFRIDQVKDGQVYLVRWLRQRKQDLGTPLRVPLDEWRSHTKELERIIDAG
jgi:hypothetical protein